MSATEQQPMMNYKETDIDKQAMALICTSVDDAKMHLDYFTAEDLPILERAKELHDANKGYGGKTRRVLFERKIKKLRKEAVSYDEEKCLAEDPFAGDYAGCGDRVLSDKIVTVRKERECDQCGGVARKGTRCRVKSEIYDGEMHSYTWCSDCCSALAKVDDDEGEECDRRRDLHRKEAE